MSSFITQCPHCETSFNITQAQLKLANGKVRCGFCLKIFSALEQQLFTEEYNSQSEIQDLENEQPSGLNAKTCLEDYYVYIERYKEKTILTYSESLNELAQILVPIKHISAKVEKTDLFVSEQTNYDSEEESEEENEETTGSSLAESYNPEEEDTEESYAKDENTLDEKVEEIEEAEESEETIETPSEELSTYTSNESLDDTLEEKADENTEADITDDLGNELDEKTNEEISSSVAAITTKSENDKKKEELQSLEELYDDEALATDGGIPLHTIREEPIPIYRQQSRSALITFALFFSNILLILGIAVQYAWANIDTYLREARFSPLTGLICNVADCPAVERFDISLFSTDQLLVNTHPSIPNALQIDFIFRNSADFAQAFPLVELSFSDLNRRLVANRLFTPEEYLQQDLQQFTQLMPNSSIQIRLEISDPGAEAINYSLTLRTP